MCEIIIRKYTDSDKPALKKYMIKDDNHHYVKDIDDWSHDKFTVAEYNSVIAGYLFASIASGNCQAFIYVSPEYRRRGIGAALCRAAENANSRRVHEKIGYKITDTSYCSFKKID